tara:strand:- start:1489 stop:1665 length:177 start_codon:yes stop_codon:yes gene_type:complete
MGIIVWIFPAYQTSKNLLQTTGFGLVVLITVALMITGIFIVGEKRQNENEMEPYYVER